MKPISLINIIGFITLAVACSKESVDEAAQQQQNDAISFGALMWSTTDVEAGTRAEGDHTPLHTIATTFKAWAFKNAGMVENSNPYNYTDPQCVIPDYTVNWGENTANSTTTNSSGWDYVDGGEQTIKYWDLDAKAYRFFGYAPATVPVTEWLYNNTDGTWVVYDPNLTDWASGIDFTSYRLDVDVDASSDATIAAAPYFSRLWFSNNNYDSSHDKYYTQVVQLEFIKPFAQVRVIFTFTDGVDIPHTGLTNISFKPADNSQQIPLSGTVTVTYPLTGTETAETITTMPSSSSYMAAITKDYWVGETPENVDDPAHLTWYTVFPVTSQGAYKMTLNVEGEEKSAYVPAEYMSWKANYSYTYIFKIVEGGGFIFDEVQVGIKNWNNGATIDHPVYNW